MHWLVKVAMFKTLSAIPRGEVGYRWLQERVTGSAGVSREGIGQKLSTGIEYLELAADALETTDWGGYTHIDVGAGWVPTIPLLFHGAGFDRQLLCDVRPNIRPGVLAATVGMFGAAVEGHPRAGAFCHRLPPDPVPEDDVRGYLGRLGMDYRVPYTLQDIGRVQGPKLVTSTFVLTYLPPRELAQLVQTVATGLDEGGVFIGQVHFYDDYSMFDRSLPRFNRWRFSEATWDRLVNSRMMWINSLTASDYLDLFKNAGLQLLEFRLQPPTESDLSELDRIPIHPRFQNVPRDELAAGPLLWVAVRA
jgi:hypothetical protein